MKSIEFLNEYYDPENDDYSVIEIDHHRRPRITLNHLQKLRKTRSIEELEQKQRIDDVAYIYGKPNEEFE
jgi:oxalate decarboxylase/phosphoglucose isomerase-like protein (cupin superfamily)